MDIAMDNVLGAFVYGGIGGGVGAIIGHFLSRSLKSSGQVKSAAPFLVAVFAVIGTMSAKPLLSPMVAGIAGGETEQAVKPIEVSDAQISRIMAGLRSDPLLAALLDHEPDFEQEAREKLIKAYAEGGLSALSKSSVELGMGAASKYMPKYYRRAKETDLLSAATLLTENIEFLSESAPEVCYAWQFASYGHVRFDYFRLVSALGEERYRLQQKAIAAVVENASEFEAPYNEGAGVETVRRAGVAMLSGLDPGKYDLINGRLAPTSTEDKMSACKAIGVMFRVMLESEDPSSAIRYVFTMVSQQ